MKVTASAPGKVVLSGEYAVLDGAAAICAAINRRARVTITRSADDHHVVTASGIVTTTGRFTVSDGRFEWLQGGQDYALLECVWRALAATVPDSLVLTLETQEFVDVDSGTKFGIGSSAALAVALTAALDCVADAKADIKRIAVLAHRDFQSGAGSGVDVACSLQGGVIEYHLHAASAALPWPDGLAFALLWSGVAASTDTRLEKLDSLKSHPSRAALGTAANCVATSWQSGLPMVILDEFRAYTGALRQFSVDHDLGIFDAGHAELADAADAAGVVYKPCGAGGGDIGIVLADDEALIESFLDVATQKNFKRLHLTIDPSGVQRNREDQ